MILYVVSLMDIDECPICFENMNKKFTINTPCNHKFCMGCFTQSPIKMCPVCRYSFDNNNHQRYIERFLSQTRKNNIINDMDFPPL